VGVGLRVANATVSPFRQNVVAGNGGAGVSVQAAGHIDVSPTDLFGQNTLFENDGTELFIAVLGDGFVGDGDENGHNDIVDNRTGAGPLVSYQYDPQAEEPSAVLAAERVHWGYTTTGGPPGNRIEGEVDFVPSLECPFANPGCAFGPGYGGSALYVGPLRRDMGGPQVRGDGGLIREYRALLVGDPADERAPGWIRTLGSLHWHDRADATGERVATFELFTALSEPIRTGQVGTGYRPAAEVALEMRALDALRRGEYALGRDLVELVPQVENAEVRRRLRVLAAFLDAAHGAYADAAAALEAICAITPSEEEASGLLAVSRSFARRALARGRRTDGLASGLALAASTTQAELHVTPNPVRSVARIDMSLSTASRVGISVHDALGRLILRLPERYLDAGAHRWSVRASELRAGVYLLRARVGTGGAGLVRTARFTVAR